MNKDLEQPDWAVDPAHATAICTDFIQATLAGADRDSLVVGLSGGIDSAVAAGLAVRALGKERVLGVMMPYATSSTRKVEITPMVDAFTQDIPADQLVRRGNVMARCRMIVLYDISARDGSLVLGTGNRTEALLGYTTMFGDNACALNPIGQLYKTEIRLLARHLGLPEVVLTKAPSADLWEGQADEDELGYTYAEVDRLLVHLIDQGLEIKKLEALGFVPNLVREVARRVRTMAFKRGAAPVARFPGRVDPDTKTPATDPSAGSYTEGGFH
jgi:NAD+ synthase